MNKSVSFLSSILFTLRIALLLVIGITILAIPPTTHAQEPTPTAEPAAQISDSGLFTASDARLPDETDATVIRSRAVTINYDAFTTGSDSSMSEHLILNLFEDISLVASMDRLEQNPDGGFTWVGHLPDDKEFSLVTLVVNKGVMIGKVVWLEGLYEIRYVSDDVHKIVQLNPAAFGEELPPIDVIYPEAAPTDPALLSTFDDGAVIDVLVVYSPEARIAAGSTAAIENTIILAVSETNTAYANSNIDQRINLVHMEEITGAVNDFGTDLDAIRSKTDGIMDIVHTLRDTYHADNVGLIIEDAALCGLAYRMAVVNTFFESDAFSVTSRSCAAANLSFAHELGHNMSAHHDWYVTIDTFPYTYIHGYVNLADNWRTIMAYTNECTDNSIFCPKIPYFSNPAESWGGDPIGVPAGTKSDCMLYTSYPPGSECDADVHLALNNTAATTDQFRTSQYTWVGNSTDWNTATNWTTQEGVPGSTTTVNRVPRTMDDVVIPSAPVGGNWPTISSGAANVRDVIIETGAQLTLSGGTLNVYGNWTEQGTGKLIATGGEVVFAGGLDTEVTTSADSQFPETTFGDGSTKSVTLMSDVDIDSDVTFAAGATTMPGSNTIEVAGNWNDGGGFSAESSFVVLDGVTQAVSKPTTVTTLLSEDFSFRDGAGWSSAVPSGWLRENASGFGWATGDLFDGHGGVARLWYDSSDGWLFTSAITLEPDVTYTISHDNRVRYGSETVTISFHIGSAQNSASMTQLVSTTTSNSTSYATKSDTFTVATGGTYYLGIRVQQSGTSESGIVDNIVLTDLKNLTFYDLEVGSTGSTSLLDGDVKVKNDLTIAADRVLDLATYDIVVDGTITNGGAIRQTASPTNSNTTQFLNIKDTAGTIDKYWGVSITPTTGDMGSTSVTVYGGQDCGDVGLAAGTQVSDSIQRCYDIAPTTPQTANVTFYYRSAEANGNGTPYAFHYLGSADSWEGELFSARDTGSAEASYVTATGIDNYSPFALGNQSAFVDIITDYSTAIATRDGTIGATEYAGFSNGINSGFGDVIGATSELHIDSDSSGNLIMGLKSGGGALYNEVVIYIDSISGGFNATSSFGDNGDRARSALSSMGLANDLGNRPNLTFAPGFEADYGIYLTHDDAALFDLNSGGDWSHGFIRTLSITPVGPATAGQWEIDNFSLFDFGLTPGDSFDYIATYLNVQDSCGDGCDASRSDEFHGVAALAGGNPGYSSTTLVAGDYNRFMSYEPTLVINEIIQDPTQVTDTNGEWFEIFNAGSTTVDLNGWTIKDDGSNSFTIGSTLTIAPGDYLVFCVNDDSNTNGGVTCDYDWGTSSTFTIANGDDEIVLVAPGGGEVDRVNYDGGPNFPDPTGASMCLTDSALDNNVGSNWRTSTAAYGDGDKGTPGAFNYDCFDATTLDGGTGPGGIGENDGTSALRIWLKADAGTGTTTDGASVSNWADQSGNSYDAVQATAANQPTYQENELNGNPMVRFDGSDDRLVGTPPAYTGTTLTAYTVVRRTAAIHVTSSATLWVDGATADNDNTGSVAIAYENIGNLLQARRVGGLSTIFPHPGDNVPYIYGTKFDATNNTAYLNGSAASSASSSGAFAWDRYAVGARWDLSQFSHFYNGDQAELIVYGASLSDAERIILDNYLSAKYAVAISNDKYDGDTNGNGDFDFNVAGIGREADGTHSLSHGSGIIVRDVSFLNDNGDYMLFGRQTTDCTETNADVPTTGDWATAPNPAHWGCSWYFYVTDVGATTGTGLVDIAFDYGEAGFTSDTPDAPTSNYGLLRRAGPTGQYEDITASCVGGGTFIAGDRIIFTNVDITCLGSNFTLGSKDSANSSLPVTLAYTSAEQTDDSISIAWQTATEAGTVGYNLYGIAGDGSLVPLNDRLVVATGIATVQPQAYSLTVPTFDGDQYYIEDIGIRGEHDRHGPFTIGEPAGRPVSVSPIDWPAIQAEQDTYAAAQTATARTALQSSFAAVMAAAEQDGTLQPPAHPGIDIVVTRDGIQHITYQDLLDFGIDLAGQRINRIAVTHEGEPVPLLITGGARVGPHTVIEFIGSARDTLYSDANIYNLTLRRDAAARMAVDNAAIPNGDPAVTYQATVTVEEDNEYSFLAPNGDPWADTFMMAYGSAFSQDFPIVIDEYVADSGDATLTVGVWGLTDWPVAADHRLQVAVNGVTVADESYDGLTDHPLTIVLPDGVLVEGENTLTLTIPQPSDPEVLWDIQYLDRFSITYPRAFVAQDDALTFTAAGDLFAVSGFSNDDVVVYRVAADGTPTRVRRVQMSAAGDGTFSARFRGTAEPATYTISTVAALAPPVLEAGRPLVDITSGSADYLMVSHGSFVDSLAPLVQFHQNNGLTVKVVDTADIYAQFGYGHFEPQAIRDYIAHAINNMGVQYVLLVGGDTYDYFDNLGLGSISFVPSLYGPTEPYVTFAPLDPLYVDVDGDGLPDAPIGRFPVRTSAELDNVIAKTLAYAGQSDQSILLAADDGFSAASASFEALVPSGWQVTTAYLDDGDVAAARQTVLDTLNGTVRLTSFLGHSGPTTWTFDGLFNATDAANLTNTTPTVVTQWGCWNTYHVDPAYNTLAHTFMLNEGGGAAAVLGAATLTLASSDQVLGPEVLSRAVVPGLALGDAVQQAKDAIAYTGLEDVILGWTLLGDPALIVEPGN
ncbi:MAG: C25 family cysteine peptidase [Anaerolineae bacterium]|nr:C25 family cysteine peptidase [Anaerolineae bacterium]